MQITLESLLDATKDADWIVARIGDHSNESDILEYIDHLRKYNSASLNLLLRKIQRMASACSAIKAQLGQSPVQVTHSPRNLNPE